MVIMLQSTDVSQSVTELDFQVAYYCSLLTVFYYRLLQCSCHLGLLGRAMDVDQKDTDQLETQFASMSLNSATGSGGVSR